MFQFRPPALPTKGVLQTMTCNPTSTSSTYNTFQPLKLGQPSHFSTVAPLLNQNLFQQQPNQQEFPQFSNDFQTVNNGNFFENQLEFASLAINSQTYQYENKSKITAENKIPTNVEKNMDYDIKKFKEQKENEIIQKDAELVLLKSELENIKFTNSILIKDKNEKLEEMGHIKESITTDERELNKLKEHLQNSQLMVDQLEKSLFLLEKQLEDIKKHETSVKQEKVQLKFNLKSYKLEREFMQERYQDEINKLNDEIKKQEAKCCKFQDAATNFELEKNHLFEQMNELKTEYQTRHVELQTEIKNNILYMEEKQQEQQQCEMELEELQIKLKESEDNNKKLQTEMFCISDMEIIQLKLKDKIAMLENEVQNSQNHIVQKDQEFTAENGRFIYLCDQYERLERESFLMAEDLKKLYFKVKELKIKVTKLEEIKLNLELNNETLNNEINMVKRDNNKLSDGKEELIDKMQIIEATQSSVKDITDKLSILLQNKDTEHQRVIGEKDELIRDLRQQNSEYSEKIQLVQMEKENVFRSFHEMMLTTLKTTPSISTVPPLSKTDSTPEKSQSNTNAENLKSIESVSLSQTIKTAKSTPTKMIEMDSIPATQSPFKATVQTNVFSTPSKSQSKDLVNTPIKTSSVVAAIHEAKIALEQSPKPGILANINRVKRKLNFADDTKKTVKTVRFSTNQEGKKGSTVSRYTRSRDKNTKEKNNGVEMSFVKRKLDAEKHKSVNEKNIENEKSKTTGSKDNSWIDDIFGF